MQTVPVAAGVSVPVLYRYIWCGGMRERQIFVYLPFVRIYVRMRKKLSLLLTLALCAVCTLRVQAGEPESETFIERGRSLFDYGRWSDARHEFLRARDVLAPSDRVAAQTVDFYLAACAVELGSRDAEGALRDFEARYPGSVYANDVRFSLGSLYCAEGDMRRAREAFAKTDYKALSRSRKEQYDIRMGYVEFTDGNYDKAFGYFDRIGPRANMPTMHSITNPISTMPKGATGVRNRASRPCSAAMPTVPWCRITSCRSNSATETTVMSSRTATNWCAAPCPNAGRNWSASSPNRGFTWATITRPSGIWTLLRLPAANSTVTAAI